MPLPVVVLLESWRGLPLWLCELAPTVPAVAVVGLLVAAVLTGGVPAARVLPPGVGWALSRG